MSEKVEDLLIQKSDDVYKLLMRVDDFEERKDYVLAFVSVILESLIERKRGGKI